MSKVRPITALLLALLSALICIGVFAAYIEEQEEILARGHVHHVEANNTGRQQP